jgi:hypothetical protein
MRGNGAWRTAPIYRGSPCDSPVRTDVEVFVNTFFEKRVEQLFELAERVEKAFSSAGLEYRVAGGLAAYLYVEEVEPDAGRLTYP